MAADERPEVATKGLEVAAVEVAYEIDRMLELGHVPQLDQIRHWSRRLRDALLERPWPYRLHLEVSCMSCPFQIGGSAGGQRLYYRWRPGCSRRSRPTPPAAAFPPWPTIRTSTPLRSRRTPKEEVDALVAILGRVVGCLRTGLEETDQLARAGETVGYESAYRILRRAVVQVLEDPLRAR